MSGEIIIPGGTDAWSRQSWGPFQVGAEHTVFEWCMIYTDQHPAAFLGPYTRSATAEHREARLTLLGTNWPNEPGLYPHPTKTDEGVWRNPVEFRTRNAVYRELADAIAGDRLAAKRVYLDDRPDELDPTLCMIGAAPVLAIARQRKDHGEIITRLLAAALAAAGVAVREDQRRPQGSDLAAVAWPIALRILDADSSRPPRGYGRLITIARLVNAELHQGHKDDSISKAIRQSVREWEDQHPHK